MVLAQPRETVLGQDWMDATEKVQTDALFGSDFCLSIPGKENNTIVA